MNRLVMVDPSRVPGEHDVFVCGEDPDAKRQVAELLQSFGWPAAQIRDLGGISSARGTEMYVALWLRLWGAVGTGDFDIAVVQARSTGTGVLDRLAGSRPVGLRVCRSRRFCVAFRLGMPSLEVGERDVSVSSGGELERVERG
jgi:hypothetical protein